jgi:RNA polymerase sigma-70 factor (ECF subfamily)
MCGNHDDAEDVLAESLVHAYRALPRLQAPEAFRAWLTQISRRACGRLKKRAAARRTVALSELEELGLEISTPEADPEQLAIERELKRCLIASLNKLPPQYREVYELRELEGMTAEEVSVKTGLSIGNIKSRLHRARARIRQEMDQAIS